MRDLETAEIVDQVRTWQRAAWRRSGRRVTNVVFMGMGEPLLNIERVIAAAEAITDARRFGLGRASRDDLHLAASCRAWSA